MHNHPGNIITLVIELNEQAYLIYDRFGYFLFQREMLNFPLTVKVRGKV